MDKIISFNTGELFLIRSALIYKIEGLNKINQWFFDNNHDLNINYISCEISKYNKLLENVNSILGGKV